MSPCQSLPEHLFCLSRWTMSMNNVGLLETSNSMVTLTCFPWCQPKWFWDEINNQSQILQGLGTTSWSKCKQPLGEAVHLYCQCSQEGRKRPRMKVWQSEFCPSTGSLHMGQHGQGTSSLCQCRRHMSQLLRLKSNTERKKKERKKIQKEKKFCSKNIIQLYT